MTYVLKIAEQMVRQLVADANRSHIDATWRYELTSEVDNISVETTPGVHTLQIHPCWLRYVVSQGDFDVCVAGEVESYYLLAELTSRVPVAA